MMSEWLKVMLEEIARKKSEAEDARLEAQQRAAADGTGRAPSAPDGAPAPRDGQRGDP
jgi:hypothetical protein